MNEVFPTPQYAFLELGELNPFWAERVQPPTRMQENLTRLQDNIAPLPPTPAIFSRRHGQRLQATANPEISVPSLQYTQMWLGTKHALVNITSDNYIQSMLMLWMMYTGPIYYCPNLEVTAFKPATSDTYASIMKP